MNKTVRLWRNFDFVLFGTVVVLIIYGVLMIRSATLGAVDTDLISRVPRQIQYAIIGIAMMFVFAAIDYRLLAALQPYIYGVMVFLLALVAVLGQVGDGGAQRWLTVGLPVQPSELAKVLIVIVLGQHLQRQYSKMDRARTVFISLGYVGLPAGFIFLQPSLGITILILFIWLVMVWAAGLRWKHIVLFSLAAVLVSPMLWLNMQDYQRARISNFFTCQDTRDAACYNIFQARISIGSGGLLGKGYASGTQSRLRFLRVRHTDFIFSVIAEELGFVGASLVFVLIGIVLWRIMRAAARARDALGSLICYGIAAIIFFQTVVSTGMNLSVLPVTGLTLPFISSGGSSLLTLLIGIGVVQSVIMRSQRS
ncbi:MAG: FtsW/RodA/SpoVE family cell cycle protein [Anaerolineae bacterium]|nr:rod shape-determining protein RodA [Anaerolineae bacterium]MDW8299745.1 FtsW/RodA/SpoVE family cell cycle protein [Anaerolineae bacterium]